MLLFKKLNTKFTTVTNAFCQKILYLPTWSRLQKLQKKILKDWSSKMYV